jgi:predicted RNA-binding protein YlqC (UPF0109 family)
MTAPTSPEEVLRLLVEAMVDHPDDVQVNCTESQTTAIIDVYVDPSDVRTILNTMYSKLNKRLYLQIEQHPAG